MKKFLWLLFFLPSVPAFSQADRVWTLEECVERAIQENITVKQAANQLVGAQNDKDAAMANLAPNLNFQGGYFWNFGLSIDPITNIRQSGDRQTASFTLSSSWVLFDGLQNVNQISISRLDYAASTYSLEDAKNSVALNVVSAYLQVLLDTEISEITQEQLVISTEFLDRTQKLYDAGSIPKGEFLQAEAQVASDEQALVTANNSLSLSKLALAQLLMLESSDGLEVTSPDDGIEVDNTILSRTPQSIYEAALETQPGALAAEMRKQSAEKSIGLAEGSYYPTLSLSGQINSNFANDLQRTTRTIDTLVPLGYTAASQELVLPFQSSTIPLAYEDYPLWDQFSNNINYFVGVNLSIPIFNRLQTRNGVRSAKIRYENAHLDYVQVQNDLYQTIQRAHADAQASFRNYFAAQRSVEANAENFAYATERKNVGAINQYDYQLARNNLLQAESQRLQSKYDYFFKIKTLEFYLNNQLTF